MAHLYWRGKVAWIKYYAARKPVYKSLGPISPAEATRIKEEVERGIATRKVARLVPGLLTVEEVLRRFLADKREHTEKATSDTYDKHARAIRASFPCNRKIGDIDPEDVREYLRGRRKTVGPRTVNHERTTLSILWKWAMREELVERNPVAATKPYPIRAAPPHAATAELVAGYVAALRAEASGYALPDAWTAELTADVLEVLWWTGWRMGETCALRVADVDTKAWTCPLRSAWNKGNREAVLIPPEVQPIIASRIEIAKARKKPSDFVFGAFLGGNPYRPIYAFRNAWIKAEGHSAHRAANFHALRHGYATDLKRAGVDPHTRQILTRHATAGMLGHYTHDDPASLRAAHSLLGEVRRQPPRPPPAGP